MGHHAGAVDPDRRQHPRRRHVSGGRTRIDRGGVSLHGLRSRAAIAGKQVDVAFIGSCTNGRFSDFEEVVKHLQRAGKTVKPGVRALVVPGSQQVRKRLIEAGYDKRLHRCWLRVSRSRLLDVSGDEPGQARRARAVRIVEQPQLQGPPRLTRRTHAADVAGNGRGGRGHGRTSPTHAKSSPSPESRN